MHEQRVMLRREIDKQRFEHCPKFERHDLSEDQIIDIIKRIKQEENADLGAFIKQTSKEWIPKIVLFIIGGAYLLARWFESHGLKVF
jgi:hypothetical protein